MIVLHKSKYNPKIDFLISKNLLQDTPRDCDELNFKKCFFGKRKPEFQHEKRIVKIKWFFKTHNIMNLSRNDIQILYGIISGKKERIANGIFIKIYSLDDIEILANLVRHSSVSDKYALFRVLLLEGFCKANNRIVIPYRWMCRRLFDSLELDDITSAYYIWKHIQDRTSKYFESHDISENANAIKQIELNKPDFLKTVGAKDLFLFGSLAIGNGNKYSDVDMIAVFPDEKNTSCMRTNCYDFWREKLSIPFDLIVMSEQEFNTISRPAIKRTLKQIGGRYDVD